MKNLFCEARFRKVPFANIEYAPFDTKYIVSVKNYVGGRLKIHLESMIDTIAECSWNTRKTIWLSEYSVAFIQSEIKHFKKTGKWFDPR